MEKTEKYGLKDAARGDQQHHDQPSAALGVCRIRARGTPKDNRTPDHRVIRGPLLFLKGLLHGAHAPEISPSPRRVN